MSNWKKIRGNHYLMQGICVLAVIDCTGGTPPMARLSILPEHKGELVIEMQHDFSDLESAKNWCEQQAATRSGGQAKEEVK